jgi:formate dehydrogenase subunit delta
MSHTVTRLVAMANQIGRAFAHRKPEEAEQEIAAHLKSFWEKRMLAQIYAHIDAGAEGLDALPKRSLERIRQHHA